MVVVVVAVVVVVVVAAVVVVAVVFVVAVVVVVAVAIVVATVVGVVVGGSSSNSCRSSSSNSSSRKKFSLTLPWVLLFPDSGLYQSPESLRTRRRTCAVPRRALFCSSTSLIVPGIWASQPGNLSAIAPSAPTTTGSP